MRTLMLLCILSIIVTTTALMQNIEQFGTQPIYSIKPDMGLPLVLLEEIQPKKQIFFTELNGSDIVKLIASASPSKTIKEFMEKLNKLLQEYDKFTYNVHFKVLSNKSLNNTTTQLLIYREGKMYGFLVNWNSVTGIAEPTGFIVEQDFNMYIGNSTNTQQSYPFDETDVHALHNNIDYTIQQQATAIYQDRGISPLV